jgi:trans-AT polyketide synthase, acyltransferase and oxidoreductase domains
MSSEHDSSAGFWHDPDTAPAFAGAGIVDAIARFREPAFVIRHPGTGSIGVAVGGRVSTDPAPNGRPAWPVWGSLPPLYPEWLGDRSFTQTHGVRFPYVTGAMANGIATTQLVAEVGRAGCLGFFGAAGLAYGRVEQAVAELSQTLGDSAA